MECDLEAGTSLRALAASVASGRVSATSLVEDSLRRTERFGRALGAVINQCAEPALRRAAAMDSGALPRQLPLAGLPMLVKDNQDVRGMVTSHGSWLYAQSEPAATTAFGPRRLEAAGAIIVGKTNLPELSSEGYTTNPRFGPTANPWNVRWNPGGSSGGSAAALAAGLAPIVTGTDGGGSIRIPAAWCGLLGLKPTLGIIGRRPVPAWLELSTDGILAQRPDDLAMLLSIMAGQVDGDVTGAPWAADSAPDNEPAIHRIVAVPRVVGQAPLPPDVEVRFVEAVEQLAVTLSARSELRDPGDLVRAGNPDSDWFRISSAEQAWALGSRVLDERAAEMDPVIHRYLMLGLATSTRDYLAARRRRYAYAAELDAVLTPGTVIVTPTATVQGIWRDGVVPGRTTPGTRQSTFTTMLLNLTGHPALSIPAGLLDNGLPFGLQVVARRWADLTLVGLARRWQREHPWPLTAPGYPVFGC